MPSKEPAWNENDGKLQRVLHVLVLALTFIDHEDGPLGGRFPPAQRVAQRVGCIVVGTAFDVSWVSWVKVDVHFRS